MLLGAAATCYVITLAAMIERTKLPHQEMYLDSEGIVDVTNGDITYKKIIHKPKVILREDSSEADHNKLEKLVEKADKSCMIYRALRGNVAIELQPNLS